MRRIVFDIETKNIFEEVGKNEPALLDISLLAIHDSETDSYHSFLEDELPKLWPILERADVLIGYNSDHFDIPILNKYYPGDLKNIRSVDLMRAIKDSLGRRLSLGNVAQATLGYGKGGSGLQAHQWWKEGEIEKIRKYCIEDVRITKELYEHALKHGKFKYRNGPDMFELEINTAGWEDKDRDAITHTLPI